MKTDETVQVLRLGKTLFVWRPLHLGIARLGGLNGARGPPEPPRSPGGQKMAEMYLVQSIIDN